jgi:opacity protein-like surface antigen
MKHFPLLLILLITLLPSAQAAEHFTTNGIEVSVEPVVGYEFTHLTSPDLHTKLVLIYGARVTAGSKFLSAEGEYTRGSTNDSYLTPARSVTSTIENIKLGVRSTYVMGTFLEALARAGGEASREKSETLASGVTSVDGPGPWAIHPYLGVGLESKIGSLFSLSASANYVFNDLKDFSKNNVQTTLSTKYNFRQK